MKTAKMSIEQFRMENQPSYAIIKITNAEGPVAEKCEELGYKKMMIGEYWMRIYNNAELAQYRNPFFEMITNGMITK